MTAGYREIAPHESLAGHVHCLWTFEGREQTVQRIVPDGRCELIVHYGTPYTEVGANAPQPRVLFAGQLTRPLHLKPAGTSGIVAVRFRPAAAFAFTGVPLHTLTNKRVPLAQLHGTPAASDLVRDIRSGKSASARLKSLQAYVATIIGERGALTDTGIEAIITQLERGAPLERARRASGLTPRALQRRFAYAVGIPPRLLASIIRFRRVFDALRDADARSWTQAAQAAGYFDHPQLARDFRRFVGCTAREFLGGDNGLAASIANVANIQAERRGVRNVAPKRGTR